MWVRCSQKLGTFFFQDSADSQWPTDLNGVIGERFDFLCQKFAHQDLTCLCCKLQSSMFSPQVAPNIKPMQMNESAVLLQDYLLNEDLTKQHKILRRYFTIFDRMNVKGIEYWVSQVHCIIDVLPWVWTSRHFSRGPSLCRTWQNRGM